ncbi:MAG: SUMF1/EgtB/PvdO family nonheme iron enzyme [Chloroflexota bacterium]
MATILIVKMAIHREAGINETSAVGAFVEGASPYGVLDMIGNVWEWCLTDYRHPVEYLRDENISANSLRVVRGGSWFDTLYYARNAYRDYDYPFLRDIYVGFRVVRPAWARK